MGFDLRELLFALEHLDRLIEGAVAAAEETYRTDAKPDQYRGLYISPNDVARLLTLDPGAPLLVNPNNEPDELLLKSSALTLLRVAFDLSVFDVDVIVIALACEIDQRYERLYAYLQDDVTRRRPTVDLALNLLCASAEERLTRRTHFLPDAPLIRHGIVRLVPDPNHVEPPLLAHYLKLDEQIIRLLLGQESLDPRLQRFCELRMAGELGFQVLSDETRETLSGLIREAFESQKPLQLFFHGQRGTGKRQAAETLARELGLRLLVADLRLALASESDFQQAIALLFREAQLKNVLLYIGELDAFFEGDRVVEAHYLAQALMAHKGIAVVAGQRHWLPLGFCSQSLMSVFFPKADFELRRRCWHGTLRAFGITAEASVVEALASQFRIDRGGIETAVAMAQSSARWRAAQTNSQTVVAYTAEPNTSELFAAARSQSGNTLAKLTRKLEPKYTWQDIVLPADQLAQLREICSRARNQHIVYNEWGFEEKLSLGKGLNVLFSGPPGTGKTMAAEVIASELQLDIYKIDLSQVVSKYIGETEKNLDRIFAAAENTSAILFFDEADALFGKRSEVKDSHDRYANIEIAYLLQKMEEYEGVAILATNLRQNLDQAFLRRIQIIVDFPFPEEESRRRIWEVMFPRAAPLGDDIDFEILSREIKLTGGNIRNIALAASFYAASDGRVIRTSHLAKAALREHQKLGRAWNANEFPAADKLT